MKKILKHPTENAFIHRDIPLSDFIHGIYKLLPLGLLYTINKEFSEHVINAFSYMIREYSRGVCTVEDALNPIL